MKKKACRESRKLFRRKEMALSDAAYAAAVTAA
jgi:hypothetical protein